MRIKKTLGEGNLRWLFLLAGITPLLGWATVKLPFTPVAFATGLTIFCIMPTTLGVGVSLVTSAKVCFLALQWQNVSLNESRFC